MSPAWLLTHRKAGDQQLRCSTFAGQLYHQECQRRHLPGISGPSNRFLPSPPQMRPTAPEGSPSSCRNITAERSLHTAITPVTIFFFASVLYLKPLLSPSCISHLMKVSPEPRADYHSACWLPTTLRGASLPHSIPPFFFS